VRLTGAVETGPFGDVGVVELDVLSDLSSF
jgi:hypothetical protein